jgi:hypothetical protein
MAVSAMTVFTVSASAADIKNISSGIQYSVIFNNYGEKASYKFTSNKSGKLKITVSTTNNKTDMEVRDSNNKLIKPSETKDTLGKNSWNDFDGSVIQWNSAEEKYSGTFTYEIEKGTYYIKLTDVGGKMTDKISFKANFPSADSSSDVKINGFTITMKKGGTMQLDADLSAKTDDNVTWKSSDTSVAKVSATGLVTAKSAGTATISASIGDSVQKISIKVK